MKFASQSFLTALARIAAQMNQHRGLLFSSPRKVERCHPGSCTSETRLKVDATRRDATTRGSTNRFASVLHNRNSVCLFLRYFHSGSRNFLIAHHAPNNQLFPSQRTLNNPPSFHRDSIAFSMELNASSEKIYQEVRISYLGKAIKTCLPQLCFLHSFQTGTNFAQR